MEIWRAPSLQRAPCAVLSAAADVHFAPANGQSGIDMAIFPECARPLRLHCSIPGPNPIVAGHEPAAQSICSDVGDGRNHHHDVSILIAVA
jgi:hypothetical protein